MLVQAHRGFSGRYPENTLLAFQKAVEAGADLIEFDIHLSQDEEVFVIHDQEVDRTTDGNGKVEELKSSELKSLDAGSWFDDKFAGEEIPTLVETLKLLQGQAVASIEIKTEASGSSNWRSTLKKASEVIDDLNMWDEVIFISFDLHALLAVTNIKQEAYTALIDYRPGEKIHLMEVLLTAWVDGWFAPHNILTPRLVDEAHRRGLEIISSGGKELENFEEEINKLLQLGVDGVSTNYPDYARDLIWECN